MTKLHYTLDIPLPLEEAFQLGTDFKNLPKIQPGYVRILLGEDSHHSLGHFLLFFLQKGLPTLWWGKITEFKKNSHFTDKQVLGPFKSWKHTHRFEKIPQGTRIIDDVEYELWGGFLGQKLDHLFVRKMMDQMFEGRHQGIQLFFKKKLKP